MIARAKKKAGKAPAEVSFENMFVQQLPFSDATFDVVLSVEAPRRSSNQDVLRVAGDRCHASDI
jgi:ubiquinone/menaquinone biosynthesis C-methylase UbiE